VPGPVGTNIAAASGVVDKGLGAYPLAAAAEFSLIVTVILANVASQG
jgi:hypothetical protein